MPVPRGQHKENEDGVYGKESGRTDEPMGYVRTQVASYTTTAGDAICREDNISKAPTDYTKTHRNEHHNLSRQEHLDVGQPDVHGSTSQHEEIKLTDEDITSITDTTKLYKNVSERTNQDINTEQPDDVNEDHRSVHVRQPEEDPAMKNVEYMPHHFTYMSAESSSTLRSESEDDSYSPHVSSTPYIHDIRSAEDHSGIHEHTDRKEVANMTVPSEDRPPSPEIYTHSEQFHPLTAPSQPQEELTQLKDYEPKSSKSELGNFEDLESSKSKEFHFEDPTCRVIQSTDPSDSSDHKEAIQYYNIFSQNVSDIERLQHGDYESEDHHRSQLEEQLYKHAQSEELVHKYVSSEKPVDTYAPSEEPVHTYAPSEELVHKFTPSEELVHKYTSSEEQVYTYTPSEEQVHACKQSEELVHKYAPPEELAYEYVPSKEPIHKYELSEDQSHIYAPSEEPVHKYAPSEEPLHTYAPSEELVRIDAEPEKLVHIYKQPEEPVHHYIQSEEESHRYRYEQPEESALLNVQSEQLAHKLSRAPTLPYEELDRPVYTNDQLKDLHLQDSPPKEAEEEYEHAEETSVKYMQPEDPPQKIIPHVPQISKELHYQQAQAEKSGNQHGQLEFSKEFSKEPEDEQAPSEMLDVRHTHPGILEHEHESSEDSHLRKYYSEKSHQEDVQTLNEKIKMSEENVHRWTQSTEQERYMDLHATETESGHVTSGEQDKAESKTEKYWEQQYTESSPEENHHKDDLPPEVYHKDVLSKEQEAQQEEPKTLDTHTVESEDRDVLPRHSGYEMTDGHVQSRELHSEESRDIQAEDTMDKHTDKNINGHPELEELEYNEDRPDRPEEIPEESPDKMVSETEETPEEVNFDFLEGTGVLDTSLMRCRASLGKKRCHRTPVTGNGASQEEVDPEYWMFRDSTEPKSPVKDCDENEEKEETSPDCTPENSPSSVKSPTKKGGLFSGIISSSKLKGRLKTRSKTTEEDTTKSEPKEGQEPTSPGKNKSDSSSNSPKWLQALKIKKKKESKVKTTDQ